jgi:hypothetical protein
MNEIDMETSNATMDGAGAFTPTIFQGRRQTRRLIELELKGKWRDSRNRRELSNIECQTEAGPPRRYPRVLDEEMMDVVKNAGPTMAATTSQRFLL